VGVTLLRPDGTGVSLAASTAAYDRPMDSGPPAAPTLAEMPLPTEQLLDLAQAMLAAGPFFPTPEPTATPDVSIGPDPSVPPDVDPCTEEVPPGTSCETQEVGTISTDPLVKTLASLGIEATSVSDSGSGASDGSLSALVQFHLTDDQGRAGSAAIGAFSDLKTARKLGGADQVTWCAVAPTAPVPYEWNLAADPAQACTGVEASGADKIIVFVHDEPGAEAIGATLIRADGSVVSVSVSREPSAFISSEPAALAEVPLDTAGIVDVLERLAATTT
jgi:hypothetical protein